MANRFSDPNLTGGQRLVEIESERYGLWSRVVPNVLIDDYDHCPLPYSQLFCHFASRLLDVTSLVVRILHSK